jgi:hypothetical protein
MESRLTTIIAATTLSLASLLVTGTQGFAFVPPPHRSTATSNTQVGLFDGLKEAFSAPALERSTIDAERETPIDRWMGWSVKKDEEEIVVAGAGAFLCVAKQASMRSEDFSRHSH